MQAARVLTVRRFLDIMKKIDGLWKKPPYARSTSWSFFTSFVLDHLAKETEERVTGLDNCILSLGTFLKLFAVTIKVFLFFQFIVHPCSKQNDIKKKVLTYWWWRRRTAHLNQTTYSPITQKILVSLFLYLNGKCCLFRHKTHPKRLHIASHYFLPQPAAQTSTAKEKAGSHAGDSMWC